MKVRSHVATLTTVPSLWDVWSVLLVLVVCPEQLEGRSIMDSRTWRHSVIECNTDH